MSQLDQRTKGLRAARAITATALSFLIVMMGTTLPTPLYPIYSAKLGFTELTVTILFAVYAVGVVGALLLFGGLSDELGRRPVMMIAVGLAIVSSILFLLPPSLPLLIVARVISGLGAGLMSGAGTAAVIDLYPAHRRATAGTLAVGANTGGLALGTLLSGALASLVSQPLRVPYAVHLSVALIAFVGLWVVLPAPPQRGRLRLTPRRLHVPAEIRGAFVRAVLGAGSGFAVTGVLTAVTGLFLAHTLHRSSHLLAGAVVFLAFGGMALGQLAARRMPPARALPLGCLGLVLAAGSLALALACATLAPLVLAASLLGVSAGMCLNAGIASTVEQVPPRHRGEVSSSFFAGLYLMLAVPAIGVGLLAGRIGLVDAGLSFAAAVAVLAAAVGVLELVSARREPGER